MQGRPLVDPPQQCVASPTEDKEIDTAATPNNIDNRLVLYYNFNNYADSYLQK